MVQLKKFIYHFYVLLNYFLNTKAFLDYTFLLFSNICKELVFEKYLHNKQKNAYKSSFLTTKEYQKKPKCGVN